MAKYIEEEIEEEIDPLEEEDEGDRGDNFDDEEEDTESIEEEDQEDSDEDEDEEVEEDEEEEDPTPKKEPRIPKSRLDEVIQQREDAKERNLWLEAQLEKLINASNKQEAPVEKEIEVSTFDFDKAEEDYISLVIEGEISKATKLRNDINKERRAEMLSLISNIESKVTSKAKQDSTATIEQERFDNYIDVLETKYPFLNSKSKEHNEEAVETVNTLLAGYISAGKTKTEALKLAVNKVAPFYNKEELPVKKSLGNKRTIEAGKKAAKAASAQPIKVKSGSTRSSDPTVNINKMSERDFSKLTDKELRVLRGD